MDELREECEDAALSKCNRFEAAMNRVELRWQVLSKWFEEMVRQPLKEGKRVDKRHCQTLEYHLHLLQFDLRSLVPDRFEDPNYGEDARVIAIEWLRDRLKQAGVEEDYITIYLADPTELRLRYEKIEHEKLISARHFDIELPEHALQQLAEIENMSLEDLLEQLKEELDHEGFDDIDTPVCDGEITNVCITLTLEK